MLLAGLVFWYSALADVQWYSGVTGPKSGPIQSSPDRHDRHSEPHGHSVAEVIGCRSAQRLSLRSVLAADQQGQDVLHRFDKIDRSEPTTAAPFYLASSPRMRA
jgi:hypothetical protein